MFSQPAHIHVLQEKNIQIQKTNISLELDRFSILILGSKEILISIYGLI